MSIYINSLSVFWPGRSVEKQKEYGGRNGIDYFRLTIDYCISHRGTGFAEKRKHYDIGDALGLNIDY